VRREMLTLLAGYGAAYENIVVFGATPADRELFLARGYRIDFEYRTHFNAHLEPCVVELTVPLRPGEGRVLVAYGPAGAPLRLGQLALDAPPAGPGAARAVSRFESLCGDLWIAVRLPTAGEHCLNANRSGHIAVTVGREGAHVRCERRGLALPAAADER